MNELNNGVPAILLIERSASKRTIATENLSGKGLQFLESWDIYTAMNEICDFTQVSRPDVIVVNVDSVSESFQVLTQLLTQGALGRMEYPVYTLADDLPSKRGPLALRLPHTPSKLEAVGQIVTASKVI